MSVSLERRKNLEITFGKDMQLYFVQMDRNIVNQQNLPTDAPEAFAMPSP